MRYIKILSIVFLIVSLANVRVCCDNAFQKDKSDSDVKQIIASGFETVMSALILPREHQTVRKAAAGPRSLHKPVLITSDCLLAKNRLLHAGNFESSNVASNETSEYTLVTLHCLLTV